jgi:phytoene synthase
MTGLAAGLPQPGKQPRDENFPVASLALSRPRRAAVIAFYRFAREADDIADDPALSPEEKLERLDAVEAALLSGDPAFAAAARLHALASRSGPGLTEARQLLSAFRQDAVKTRYADWTELEDYCQRSAAPVGRFLLRLHGEPHAADRAADALCTALQILNHLQDLAPDRTRLNRVYLPSGWMERAGGEAAFFDIGRAAARRSVLDAALDRVDALLDGARSLPRHLRDMRLRIQAVATIALAERLSRRLRRRDPLTIRIGTSRADAGLALLTGTARAAASREVFPDRRITDRMVRSSGSSFRLAIRCLPARRRRAMNAVYAFCRAVDDIADGGAPAAEKLRFLAEWRRELDRLHRAPETPIGRELAWASRAFDLPLGECQSLIDGMETDCAERVRLLDDAALRAYGRRVAGSAGLLSIHVFGVPEAREFALALGHTLQLVNILRDIDEDAALDRVYIPLSRLEQVGIADAPAGAIVSDERFACVCEAMVAEVETGFAAAARHLAGQDRGALKPAILMMEGYRRLFERLRSNGWSGRRSRPRLTVADRLRLLGLAARPA